LPLLAINILVAPPNTFDKFTQVIVVIAFAVQQENQNKASSG